MNRPPEIMRRKDSAVSPVIAVILLVMLTIVLVSVAAIGFMGFNIAESAPILGISIKDNDDGTVSITHLNGDVLKAGSYKILINGAAADVSGFGDFKPGSVIRLDVPANLKSVAVVYVDGNGYETLLASKEFSGNSEPELFDEFKITLDYEGNDIIYTFKTVDVFKVSVESDNKYSLYRNGIVIGKFVNNYEYNIPQMIDGKLSMIISKMDDGSYIYLVIENGKTVAKYNSEKIADLVNVIS